MLPRQREERMKKNRTLMLGMLPVIGLGINGVSYAADNRVDGYVPKTEYEKLKREVETLKSQMRRLLEAAPATPESKSRASSGAQVTQQYGPTREGDTLWRIALETRPSRDVSV